MYIYHVLINILSAHMIHINLNIIFYTNVEHSPTKTIYVKYYTEPAPVAQWLARRTVGRKVWGSNPIRVMWDFSALAGSYPELGVLWAQWEGWNHTAELHPLNGCVFEGVALIIWPTLQVPQFPGLVNTGIIVTVSVVCGPVK